MVNRSRNENDVLSLAKLDQLLIFSGIVASVFQMLFFSVEPKNIRSQMKKAPRLKSKSKLNFVSVDSVTLNAQHMHIIRGVLKVFFLVLYDQKMTFRGSFQRIDAFMLHWTRNSRHNSNACQSR